MGRAYSINPRERVVAAMSSDGSVRAAASQFGRVLKEEEPIGCVR